jgi:hypothetical protein
MGAAIELGSRHARGEGDLGAIGETLTSVGGAAQEAPPGFDEIEPSRPHRDEDLLDTGMGGEPLADGATGVTREVVGDEVEIAHGIVAIECAEQREIPCGVACRSGLGADLSIPDAQGSVDPGFIIAAAVDEWGFDAVATRRPGDQAGAGGKVRGVTGPSSSTQRIVAPAGGSM